MKPRKRPKDFEFFCAVTKKVVKAVLV